MPWSPENIKRLLKYAQSLSPGWWGNISMKRVRLPLKHISALRSIKRFKRPLRMRPFLSNHGGPTASAALTNGRPGGKEPRGKRAIRSPFLNRSEASRKAATNMAYASQKALRTALVAA
jgi:hypothetical protein